MSAPQSNSNDSVRRLPCIIVKPDGVSDNLTARVMFDLPSKIVQIIDGHVVLAEYDGEGPLGLHQKWLLEWTDADPKSVTIKSLLGTEERYAGEDRILKPQGPAHVSLAPVEKRQQWHIEESPSAYSKGGVWQIPTPISRVNNGVKGCWKSSKNPNDNHIMIVPSGSEGSEDHTLMMWILRDFEGF